MQVQEPYLLTVLTGPNAGAQVALAGRRVTLGGASEDGVILDGLESGVLELSMVRDRIRIKSACEGISVQGNDCSVGTSSILVLPVIVQISDDTQVHICRAAAPRKSSRGLGRVAAIVAALGAGAVTSVYALDLVDLQKPAFENSLGSEGELSAKAASIASLGDVKSEMLVPNPQPQAENSDTAIAERGETPSTVEGQALAADAAVSGNPVDAARQSLTSAADSAGLVGLKITADKETVRVSGRRSVSQEEIWTQVRREYDRVWGGKVPLLLGDIAVAEAVAPISVASALLGKKREVVTRDGKAYGIGDMTPDGWTVTDIRMGEVALQRDDTEIVIEF